MLWLWLKIISFWFDIFHWIVNSTIWNLAYTIIVFDFVEILSFISINDSWRFWPIEKSYFLLFLLLLLIFSLYSISRWLKNCSIYIIIHTILYNRLLYLHIFHNIFIIFLLYFNLRFRKESLLFNRLIIFWWICSLISIIYFFRNP